MAEISSPKSNGGAYWKERQRMVYYSNVDLIVRHVARNAKSLIDVGARNAAYTEEFTWIPDRYTLDIVKPYSSENVKGIRKNFFEFEPEQKFDVALCLQVLEHIDDASRFAQKLLDVGRRVVVSVPYKWPRGACKYHVQDPVSEDKLSNWFGRTPDYSIVIQEPFRTKTTGRRLIAYYHDDPASFDLKTFTKET
jgi:hypothetical protein